MHTRAIESRRASQYECSTSYALPRGEAHSQPTASVELVFEFVCPPDHTRLPPLGAFAAICFAALAPSTDTRAAGRAVLGGSRNAHSHLHLLPVGSHLSGRQQRYVWDGQAIRVIDTEELAFKQTKRQHLLAQLRDWSDSVKAAFLPDKDLVTPDYWAYSFWRNSHRFFSSAITVFATQSLLQAVGVGAKNSLPAAAGINWVLKDGLGRLGRLSVSTRFGTSFDSDLKRFRFATSLVYSGSVALEFLTPMAPQYFLLLASIANVGKSVGLATHISTQPSFVKNFARQDNLSDLTAKAQAQQMIADNSGLALAVSLTYACRQDPRARRLLPLLAFPLLALGDLCSIYRELKAIHLHNLNKQRAEILADVWLETGRIPSPAEVSKEERLLLPYRGANGGLPLQIASLDRTVTNPQQLDSLLQQHGGDKFVMAYQQHQLSAFQQRLPFGKKLAGGPPGRVCMTLQDGASTTDILTGILQAAFFRQVVAGTKGQTTLASPSSNSLDHHDKSSIPTASATPSTRPISASHSPSASMPAGQQKADASATKLEGMLADSLKHARADVKRFVRETQQAGWQTHPIMLSQTERASFALVG